MSRSASENIGCLVTYWATVSLSCWASFLVRRFASLLTLPGSCESSGGSLLSILKKELPLKQVRASSSMSSVSWGLLSLNDGPVVDLSRVRLSDVVNVGTSSSIGFGSLTSVPFQCGPILLYGFCTNEMSSSFKSSRIVWFPPAGF